MSSWSPAWLLILLVPTLMALGALAYRVWSERAAKKQRRIPRQWPLDSRPLVNAEELRIWQWLNRTFYDHHIMVKLPVTRFTLPRKMEEGMDWYRLLGSVYCSFTVCTLEGRVVGCVDVPGRAGIPRNIRQLKVSLLTQCGLPYWVMDSGELPSVSEIRNEFLGEAPTAQVLKQREQEQRAIIAAQATLRNALSRRRSIRQSDFSPLSSAWTAGANDDSRAGDLNSQWQENSFFQPLDSRKGGIQ